MQPPPPTGAMTPDLSIQLDLYFHLYDHISLAIRLLHLFLSLCFVWREVDRQFGKRLLQLCTRA